MKPESIAAQALGWVDEKTRAIVPPIHTSTTFIRDADNQYRSGRSYARDQNPTFDQAEAVLTALEGGHASLLFASGMAAATAVFQALAPGDHVLAPKVMYWSLRNWLMNFATHWGLRVEFIDMTDPDELRRAVQPGKTRLVWIETPANPLWSITDIAVTCDIAHAAGAVVAVDSTVATPVLTRPLELGADIVMHAATKYLNGHSDVIAGTLTTREDSAMWLRIKADSRADRRRARIVRGVAAHARHAHAVPARARGVRERAGDCRALRAASADREKPRPRSHHRRGGRRSERHRHLFPGRRPVRLRHAVDDVLHLPADGGHPDRQRPHRPGDGPGPRRQHPPALSGVAALRHRRPAARRQHHQHRRRHRRDGGGAEAPDRRAGTYLRGRLRRGLACSCRSSCRSRVTRRS